MKVDGSPSVPQHPKSENEKEGHLLLGPPTFTDIGNGRLRCVETGHELLVRDKDSYAVSKGCRRGLIDAFLCGNKPPLNMFKPGPLSSSKLVCKLTGDTVNKSEEHIWKHLNGKRFLNKLEQKEMSQLKKVAPAEEVENSKKAKKRAKLSKVVTEELKMDNAEDMEKDTKKAKKRVKSRNVVAEESPKLDADGSGSPGNSEEPDFWIPPVGSRWDLDDGGDRWESCESPGGETDEDTGSVDEKDDVESAELSMRTKRTTVAIGPSNFASRKKKIKTLPVDEKNDTESEELSIQAKHTPAISPKNLASKSKKKKKKIKTLPTAAGN